MESPGTSGIMSERFRTKASEWDASSRRQKLAQRIYEGIRESIPLRANMDLVDLGAGTGLLTYKILPHVHSVLAVDTSEAMLEKLREKKQSSDLLRTSLKDISKEPLEGSFDGVISSMTLHHIEHLEQLFKHLYAAMVPGGFMALADLASEDGSFHGVGNNEGVHHFGFDVHELSRLIGSVGFKTVTFEMVDVIKKEQHDYPVFLLRAFK